MPNRSAHDENRRRHPRHAVEGVHGSFLLAADAKVVNMSLTGLALETPTYLHVGRKYQVKVRFDEGAVNLAGKVVWCTLVRTQKTESGEVMPLYRAGVRFDEMLTPQGTRLAALLMPGSKARLAERLTGRLRVKGRDGSELEVIVPFAVIELSASGMRIATDVRLDVDSTHPVEIQFGETRFGAAARVVHCEREGDDGGPLIAGVEFLDVTDQSRASLKTLIAQRIVDA